MSDSGHTHFTNLETWITTKKLAEEMTLDDADVTLGQFSDLDVDFVIRQTHVEEDFAALCKVSGFCRALDEPILTPATSFQEPPSAVFKRLVHKMLSKILRLPLKCEVPKFNVTGKKFPLSKAKRPVSLSMLVVVNNVSRHVS
jgi:hypothetical protein